MFYGYLKNKFISISLIAILSFIFSTNLFSQGVPDGGVFKGLSRGTIWRDQPGTGKGTPVSNGGYNEGHNAGLNEGYDPTRREGDEAAERANQQRIAENEEQSRKNKQLFKDEAKKSAAEVNGSKGTDPCARVSGGFASNCAGDKSMIKTADTLSEISETLGAAGAKISADSLNAEAAKDPNNAKNLMEKSGKEKLQNGGIQSANGVLNAVSAGMSGYAAWNHGTEQGILEKRIQADNVLFESLGCAEESTSGEEAECAGLRKKINIATDALAEHGEVETEGLASFIKNGALAVKNMGSGGMLIKQGQDEIEDAKKYSTVQPTPAPAYAPTNDYSRLPTIPDPVMNPTPVLNDYAATADPNDAAGNAGNENLINAPRAGASNPGGLKGPIAGAGAGTLGAPSINGGGAAGGGGGAGGGQGVPSDAQGAEEESVASTSVGFGGAGTAGGPGFAGGAANSANRMNNTGMDLNGILAKFFPKKEDEAKKDDSILSFGKNGQGRNLASEDGSLLGADAHLFPRIHKVMIATYEKDKLIKQAPASSK